MLLHKILPICVVFLSFDCFVCSQDDGVMMLLLPEACNDTDVMIWNEDGSPLCWKCECFDGLKWGCFQGSDGDCTSIAPPRVPEFPPCRDCPFIEELVMCDEYSVGEVWISETTIPNQLCLCGDNEQPECYQVAPDETDFRTQVGGCLHDNVLVLNTGDSVISNNSICTCFNGTIQCVQLDIVIPVIPELVCPASRPCELLILQEFCKNDTDCASHEKCCVVGCERTCVEANPSASKPGVCPSYPPDQSQVQCDTDYECQDHLKCCAFEVGGYLCQEPYDPDDCPDGVPIYRCYFTNPCETTLCPKHPTALCRVSHCGGCHAQYFVNNERVNCFDDDVCDINTPLYPCNLKEDCSSGFQPLCPNAPDAECRINYCGSCFYEHFDQSNTKVACTDGDPCPVGIEEHFCEHTCDQFLYACPEAEEGANLTCVANKCGGCSYPSYVYDNGTEAKCFKFEECPADSIAEKPRECRDDCSILCTNPEAVVCKTNYCHGRCFSEYFNATGHRVSCFGGAICENGQETNPDFFCGDPCAGSACPAYPDAVCRRRSCDYQCEAVFFDPLTMEQVNCTEGFTCPEDNPVNPFCVGDMYLQDFFYPGCYDAVCPRHPEAKCIQSSCGVCRPEFYIGADRVNCFGDIICPIGIGEDQYCVGLCEGYCPAYPEAICVADQCGKCQSVYQFLNGTIVDDCFTGITCPDGEVDALCPFNLCESETCVTHPDAICTLNHCGQCRAQFILPNGTHVQHCSRISCRPDEITSDCGDICAGWSCSNHPDAECYVDACSQCNRAYFSPNGTRLSLEQCKEERLGFCPILVFPFLAACSSDKDCPSTEKCCTDTFEFGLSVCVEYDKVNPLACFVDGVEHEPGFFRTDQCETCVCNQGDWVCYPTKCDLQCPVDAPLDYNCVADDCAPTSHLCPAYPDSRCTINPCGGCTIEYLDANTEIVNCYDPALIDCPVDTPPVTCEFNPCDVGCPAYQSAECTVRVCGTCVAEYVLDNRVVDCFEEPSCFEDGHQFVGSLEFRTSSGTCQLCICVSHNISLCFPSADCAEPQPCVENGVTYAPLFEMRANCTECVCSGKVNGQFVCVPIPECEQFEKEGTCPRALLPESDCTGGGFHECNHDGDCDGTDKCCRERCTYTCQPPQPEGLQCFSCTSFFSPDIAQHTENTCSDVTLPTVSVMTCPLDSSCMSASAQTVFTDGNGVATSLSVFRRGCANEQFMADCSYGDASSYPGLFVEVEEWIIEKGGSHSSEDFSVSACYCNQDECNHLIPPTTTSALPTTIASTRPVVSTEPRQGTTTKMATTEPPTTSADSTTRMTTVITSSSSLSADVLTTEMTTQITTRTTRLTAASTKMSTAWPMTSTAAAAATSTAASTRMSTARPMTSTAAAAATSETATKATTSPTMQSPSTNCENGQTLEGNACTNCLCIDGFFACQFDQNCADADGIDFTVSISEISYKLSGIYKDIDGQQTEFTRALIGSLMKELTLDESVFLDVSLSAGSINVVQNVTDNTDESSEMIAARIQQLVDEGSLSFVFRGQSYSSIKSSSEISNYYPFSAPEGSNTLVIIIGVSVAVVIICLTLGILAVLKSRNRRTNAENTVLLRLSRNPSVGSKEPRIEFENPIYGGGE